MGQQQLLLLVLATVIVGLATVAGIQAFDENQTQAAQDALVQRGTTIMSDIKGELNKPADLGGVDYSASASDVLDKMGYENGNDSTVPVEGAPGGGTCDLGFDDSNNTAGVVCTADAANQDVKVTLNASGNDEVSTEFGTGLTKPGSGGGSGGE